MSISSKQHTGGSGTDTKIFMAIPQVFTFHLILRSETAAGVDEGLGADWIATLVRLVHTLIFRYLPSEFSSS